MIRDATERIKKLDSVKWMLIEKDILIIADDIMGRVEMLILEAVEQVIEDTLQYYSKDLYENTGKTLAESSLNSIKSQMYTQFTTFPFKGNTLNGRFQRLDRKLKRNVMKNGKQCAARQVSRKELINRLVDCFYAPTPVRHATLWGSSDTLLVSEENRFYHETALAFLKHMGIRHVRFVLTPQHSSGDICDDIASHVDPVIKELLEPHDISPVGVYRVEELPEYPHPRALYYLEPIYLD